MDIAGLQEFYRGFDITAPLGNNRFAFEHRKHRTVYVPPLIKGGLDAVACGPEVVFSDLVDGVEVNARGLKHFVHIERPGHDIFVMDNHNHAFSCWAAGIHAGAIRPGARLVHVDQHKDTRPPPSGFTGHGVQDACRYANDVLDVGNFILPAVGAGWFQDVVQVGSAEALMADPPAPFVLDIDLDIFAPVMDYIPRDLKLSRLRAWIATAPFITIATSPFFMDQNQAIESLRALLT